MDCPTVVPLRIGAWRVDPALGQISREKESVRLDARTMRLLIYLAERAGAVVSSEELLEQVWNGVVVSQDSVYQGIAALRRILNDDARNPIYIATVPRLGYRLVAHVSPCREEPSSGSLAATVRAYSHSQGPASPARRRSRWAVTAGTLVVSMAALAVIVLVANRYSTNPATNTAGAAATATVPMRSVAVLPFLDLTSEKMSEEYFADGMTEALIDRLSQIPGIRVPAPASSFYYKNKRTPVADIARSLGVVYVLSGSIRQADDMLRIAVRLVRADNGYVIWSRSYDRPAADKLKVQDDIATEVARALKTSIG